MSDKSIWVIAYTPGGTFLGKVTHVANVTRVDGDLLADPYPASTQEEVEVGFFQDRKLLLSPYFTFIDQYMPQQTPQGLGYLHVTKAMASGATLDEKGSLWVTPVNLKFIDDESASDREAYMNLIKEAQAEVLAQRAHRSGITTPEQGMPPGIEPGASLGRRR